MYDVDNHLAMAYGEEFNPNEVLAYQLREFSEEIAINYKLVSKVLFKQSDLIIKNLEKSLIIDETLNQKEH